MEDEDKLKLHQEFFEFCSFRCGQEGEKLKDSFN